MLYGRGHLCILTLNHLPHDSKLNKRDMPTKMFMDPDKPSISLIFALVLIPIVEWFYFPADFRLKESL